MKKSCVWHVFLAALLCAMVFIGCTAENPDDNNNQFLQDNEQGEQGESTDPKEQYDPISGFGFWVDYGMNIATERLIVAAWSFGMIAGYHGTFNGYVVVQPEQDISQYYGRTVNFDEIRLHTFHPGLYVWKNGSFHDIEALYKQGMLTRDDIIRIGDNGEKEIPPPKSPSGAFVMITGHRPDFGIWVEYGLDIATEKQIVESWNFNLVYGYHGTYNGYVVVQPATGGGTFQHWSRRFDDIILTTYRNGLFVWKDGQFHDIQSLYNIGLLTQEDIIMIGETGETEIPPPRYLGGAWLIMRQGGGL